MPRIWPGFLAVWAAILLHGAWFLLLLLPGTSAQRSTPVHQVALLVGSPHRAALLFGAVATVALLGLFLVSTAGRKIAFLLPQQLVLGISAAGAIVAMTRGMYADGVPRPSTFIIADQLAVVLTWAFHTLALMYLYSVHTGRLSLGGQSRG